MLSRQEIIELYKQGPEAIADLILQLSERIQDLEDRLNKNSQNSHKPPSSDGLKKKPRKPKRVRGREKRKPGGQKDHPGTTLKMSGEVDHIIRHETGACRGCGHDLSEMIGVIGQKRQVIDIPQPKLIRTEHQSIVKACPCCGASNAGQIPNELKGNVQYGYRLRALVNYLMIYQLLPYERTKELMQTLYALSLSTGTLHRMIQDAYHQLEEAETAIKSAIVRSEVIHCDETGHRVGSKTRWLHVASTKLMTFYYSNKARGQLAHEAGGILPKYKGIAVHDFYSSYLKVECQHALCNAHLIRELKAVVEREPSQLWAKALIRLMVTANRIVQTAKEKGKETLSRKAHDRLMVMYDALLSKAADLNPKAEANRKRGRTAQTKTRNLIDRLITYKSDILRFISDFKVPFDNNLAERDLRMVKVQQKISNCFRSELGAEMFCRIRGYISTLLKQDYEIFPILTEVMQGKVFIPTPAE